MQPFPPATAFYSSFPLIEMSGWRDGTNSGDWYDTVDYLPAVHDEINGGVGAVHEVENPDPRYFVSYLVSGTGWNLDLSFANHSRAVFFLQGASSSQSPMTVSNQQIIPLNEAATITVGALGQDHTRDQGGILRGNARFVRGTVIMSGTPVADFAFGAYLRTV